MPKSETIHERIGELVAKFANGKNTVFASMIGTSEGNIRGYIKGVIPKQDILEKIVRCLDINSDWLLTGRGEILATNSPSLTEVVSSSMPTVGMEKEIFLMLRDKDTTIREMAEEIGMLKQKIVQLEREKGNRVSDVSNSMIADAG